MRIKLTDITIDPAVAIRQGTDDDTIQRYMDTFDELPPIIVYQTDHKYLLADGFHRWAAASRLGHDDIEAEIREGDYEAASEYAIYANLKHGKPLSREEYKNAVRRLNLLHPDWGRDRLAQAVMRSSFFVTTILQSDEVRRGIMIPLEDRIAQEISRAPQEMWHVLAQAAKEQDWTVEQTANVMAILKTQPDTLEQITSIPKSQLSQTLDATLDEINHKTQEAITTIEAEIKVETPEDLRTAAKTLYKEATKRAKAELTPEQREAKKTEKEAKKREKTQRAREKAEKMSLEEIEAIATKVVETDPGRAYQLKEKLGKRLNRKERNTQKQQQIEAISLPKNKYRAIVIDPPWGIDKIAREERMNQFDFDYHTMTLDQIMSLPIPDLASEDGCHIYLWATHKHLPDAFDILEAWGAKYQCLLTWVKNVGMTPFSWMYSTEHCLFARIGNLDLLKMGKRLDFHAKVREHSRKPNEFYDLVREVSPAPRIDMFGREPHEGFDVWGNEPNKFKASIAVEAK